MDTLATRVAYIRTGLGLTQDEFAEELSTLLKAAGRPAITRGAVGNWEAARGRGIDRHNMRAVTKLAEISLDWLDGGEGDPPSRLHLQRIGERLLGETVLRGTADRQTVLRGTIPVLGQAAGATLDEGATVLAGQDPIGELPMLPGLVGMRDVYGLEATGTSMLPMVRPGDPLYVSPHLSVGVDDLMIVTEHRSRNGSPVTFIKLMVQNRRDEVIGRQLNPDLKIRYPKKPGLTIHRVLTFREAIGYTGGPEPQLDAPSQIRRGPKSRRSTG